MSGKSPAAEDRTPEQRQVFDTWINDSSGINDSSFMGRKTKESPLPPMYTTAKT